MGLLENLLRRASDPYRPFLLGRGQALSLHDVAAASEVSSAARPGDVVALIGGFDPASIAALLRLLDIGAVVVPLTRDTEPLHPEYFASARVNLVLRDGRAERLGPPLPGPAPLDALRKTGEAGLVLFSSGTTGAPKAILHAAGHFLARYATPRPAMRTLAFLLFDHIGGLNTLFHMLYNQGQVVVPRTLAVQDVLADLREFAIELLPATPTFLRLLLLNGLPHAGELPDLRLITYGTERMDQPTLDALCAALPATDFRQTYGMSELGILRVVSRARNSLWMRVGGEGVLTRVEEGVLHIRAEHRMLGYLNAPCPFAASGWFRTGDLAETDGPWLRITGRCDDVITVGGLKVLPAEVERACLRFPGVQLAKAVGGANPLTGQHVELICQFDESHAGDAEQKKRTLRELKRHLAANLPAHAVPMRIRLEPVAVSHRYKRK